MIDSETIKDILYAAVTIGIPFVYSFTISGRNGYARGLEKRYSDCVSFSEYNRFVRENKPSWYSRLNIFRLRKYTKKLHNAIDETNLQMTV